jgi:hypothetical protein
MKVFEKIGRKEGKHLQELDIDRMVILKEMVKEWDGIVWTALS